MGLNRRGVLVAGGAAAVGAAVGAAAVGLARDDAASGVPGPPPAFDPTSWTSVRAQFALTPDAHNFTTFVFASHPAAVRDAVDRHRAGLDADPYDYLGRNEFALDQAVATAAAWCPGATSSCSGPGAPGSSGAGPRRGPGGPRSSRVSGASPRRRPGCSRRRAATTSFEHRWALAEAFGFAAAVGPARIAARTHELATRLKAGLATIPKVRVRTPSAPELSAGIVCCEVEGYPAPNAVQALRSAKVLTSATPYATSYLRFGPSILTTESDVDAALVATRAL